MLGDLGVPPMSQFGVRSPGHEGAGVIVKKGAQVKTLKVGQRAGLKPIWNVCQMCDLCWGDKECYCPSAVYTGLAATGSYQQYVVSPEKYTSPIPEGVSDIIAGPVMCSAATMYRALKEANLHPGDYACFPGGGGGVGIQGVQLSKYMGMRPVVVDTGKDKRDLAMKMGAEAFVDFKEVEDVGAEVTKVCGGVGAHGVFVTAPSAYKTALSLIGSRVGAIVMCIGLPPPGSALMEADPLYLSLKNVTVKGTLVASMKDVSVVLDYAARGVLKQICEVWPISKLPEAVEKLRRSAVPGRIVVDFNS